MWGILKKLKKKKKNFITRMKSKCFVGFSLISKLYSVFLCDVHKKTETQGEK